jgi:murein DD-endopeptidase MepM/ murein hydrolase activator NlpD
MLMKPWIPVLTFCLFLSACSFLAPTPTATLTITPIQGQVPTSTLTPMNSPSPSPDPTLTPNLISQICTPLQDHELGRITDYISHPFSDSIGSNQETGHHGVDFSYYTKDGSGPPIDGIPVQSMINGRVAGIGVNRLPYGNMLIIETPFENLPVAIADYFKLQSGSSIYLLYAHMLASPIHKVGQLIACGEFLGNVGNSGFSGNPHLHLETRVGPSGLDLPTMIFYDTTATLAEQAAYNQWRIGEIFTLFDPTAFLNLLGDD